MHLIFITLLKCLRWLPRRTGARLLVLLLLGIIINFTYFLLVDSLSCIFPSPSLCKYIICFIFTSCTGNRANVSCQHLVVVLCAVRINNSRVNVRYVYNIHIHIYVLKSVSIAYT